MFKYAPVLLWPGRPVRSVVSVPGAKLFTGALDCGVRRIHTDGKVVLDCIQGFVYLYGRTHRERLPASYELLRQ